MQIGGRRPEQPLGIRPRPEEELPEIALLIAACTVLIVDLFVPESHRKVSYWLTMVGLLVTAVWFAIAWFANTGSEPGTLAELLIAGLNQVGIPKRPEIPAAEFAKAIENHPIATIPFEPQIFGSAANNGQMIAEIADASSRSRVHSTYNGTVVQP